MTPDVRVGAVVPAAGRGERFGGAVPKSLIALRGRPLLQYPLEVLERVDEVDAIIVVAPADAVGAVRDLARSAGLRKVTAVVPGGADRQSSVASGLAALPPGPEIVLVHDGARPLLSASLLREVVAAAAQDGCATAAVPVDETIKQGEGGWVLTTLDRSGLYRIQTPQAFRRALLEAAHREAACQGFRGTDDASLVERQGHRVRLVPGTPMNLKVTVPEDLALVDAVLCQREALAPRVGIGFDVHRFASGRPLMLGGVEVPAPRGLAGHSDADVIVHAVMDALLGAAGCGDIGLHFPPDDPAYAGTSSLTLLGRVRDLLAARGWRAGHVDVMVMAESPRLAPHVPGMRAAMAGTLGVAEDHINVKASTMEGMGAIGREEGIAAQAVASLEILPDAVRRSERSPVQLRPPDAARLPGVSARDDPG